MTAKHFNAIADCFHARHVRNNRREKPEDTRATLQVLAEDIADICAATNSRFNKARFLAACDPLKTAEDFAYLSV